MECFAGRAQSTCGVLNSNLYIKYVRNRTEKKSYIFFLDIKFKVGNWVPDKILPKKLHVVVNAKDYLESGECSGRDSMAYA